MIFRNKKTISYHIKGLYKTTCYKTKYNFSQFSFLIDCCMSVFLFPYERVCKFWEIDKIHQQAFFVYKIGKELETLIEMFCQKLKFLMLFWPFKTISNLKFSSSANMEPPPLFKISGSTPDNGTMVSMDKFFVICTCVSTRSCGDNATVQFTFFLLSWN